MRMPSTLACLKDQLGSKVFFHKVVNSSSDTGARKLEAQKWFAQWSTEGQAKNMQIAEKQIKFPYRFEKEK